MVYAGRVVSIKDARVVEARRLTSAVGRHETRKCLLEGGDAIRWALEAELTIERVYFSAPVDEVSMPEVLVGSRIPCHQVSETILKRISDTRYLVPIIGVCCLPTQTLSTEQMGRIVLVLDGLRDHGNIGTIVRTAVAFGLQNVITINLDGDLYCKKIIAASRGQVFRVRVWEFDSCRGAISFLKELDYRIVATSPHDGLVLGHADFQGRIGLVVGNETEGVSPEILQHSDLIVRIPLTQGIDSLNVSVATGIILYATVTAQ